MQRLDHALRRLFLTLAAPALLAGAASADFTVTGTFQYRDKAFTYSGGYTGSEPALPIRQANVQVIDDSTGTVLAAGPTDDNGDFSIFVTGSGTRDIIVRCQSRSKLYGSFRLRCVTTSNVLYSVSSPVFVGWDQNSDLDVGTSISEMITSGGQEANPFNMLDMAVHAMEYISSLGNSTLFGTVDVEWPGGSGSFASGFRANMADDDGYDDMVILHELGHVFHNMYSDSDSPGGSHFFGDSDQDPRLSYGEGWATFFAAAVRQHMGVFDPAFYMDANNNGSTGSGTIGLRMRLENAAPYSSTTAGEATEVGVACVLWDIVDTVATNDGGVLDDDDLDGSILFTGGRDGDQMQWDSFTGPVSSAFNLTINDHWNGFFNPTDYGNYDELRDVFDAFGIRNYLDPEEPNNSFATASPHTAGASWTPIKSLYYSGANPPAPGDNDNDYYSINLTVGEQFDVETRYPNNSSNADTYCDTYLYVYRPNGSLFAQTGGGGQGRNASLFSLVADDSGLWRIRVAVQPGAPQGRETGSYQLKIFRSGAAIDSVSPSSVACVEPVDVPVTLTGFGLSTATTLEVDGVALSKGVPGFGQWIAPDDSTIEIHAWPQVSQLGLVDIVVTTPTATATAQMQVDPVTLPILKTTTPVTFQSAGIELIVGSGLLDVVWVNASTSLVPTVIPGFLNLGIGDNGTLLATPWKPAIAAKGWKMRNFGPFTGLGGITVYWQAFALQFVDAYLAPWPESNIVQNVIVF